MSVRFCDRCGGPAAGGAGGPPGAAGAAECPPDDIRSGAALGAGHEACRAARQLEPPRYCARCGRRLVVQVRPDGWTARCSEHGPARHRD